MTFGGGLPVLYPIGVLNFFVLYWVYKGLLIKAYQKTIAFNQDLPFYTIGYFKIAVFFHVIMSCFMYTNHSLLGSERLDEYYNAAEDLTDEWDAELRRQGNIPG
jgi:hypothetical protein